MLTMIDTQVPICRVPGCSGALVRGFTITHGGYQGTYYFCVNCHTRYLIKDEGQSEHELLCEYEIPDNVNSERSKRILVGGMACYSKREEK